MLDKHSKAKNTLESDVKTQIRYTSKSLESKNHYRIRGENVNSLCLQTAQKPKNTIESEMKMRVRYARKPLESQKTL